MIKHKWYEYVEPSEDGSSTLLLINRRQIIDLYYPYWRRRMIADGKAVIDRSPTAFDLCVEDWVTIHWARPVDMVATTSDPDLKAKYHGASIRCPTCGFPGHLDTAPAPAAVFHDSVWWNPKSAPDHGSWECVDCWLK